MPEIRPGKGRTESPAGAKEYLGRTCFMRPTKDHQGVRSNEPEHYATVHDGIHEPTKLEMKLLFQEYDSDVRAYRSAGMSDLDIYDILSGNDLGNK